MNGEWKSEELNTEFIDQEIYISSENSIININELLTCDKKLYDKKLYFNYKNKSEFSIRYPTKEECNFVFRKLREKLNNGDEEIIKNENFKKDIDLIKDVVQICKYLRYYDEVGNEKAEEIISEIHNKKYESSEGIWVQVEKSIKRIEEKLGEKENE